MAALGVACLAFFSIGVGAFFEHHVREVWEGAAVVGVSLGFGILGIYSVFAFGPGATQIDIGPEAVTLRYGDRRTRRVDFRTPGSKLKLYVYPPTLPWGAARQGPRQVVLQFLPIRNPLTPDAYDFLIEWARRKGVRVEDRPWLADGPAPRRTVRLVVDRRA